MHVAMVMTFKSNNQQAHALIQCSPCKSNPDTTKFLLIRTFLESCHMYNMNGMSGIIQT